MVGPLGSALLGVLVSARQPAPHCLVDRGIESRSFQRGHRQPCGSWWAALGRCETWQGRVPESALTCLGGWLLSGDKSAVTHQNRAFPLYPPYWRLLATHHKLWPEQSCLLRLALACGCARGWCLQSSRRGWREEACHHCAAPGGFWSSAFQFYVLSSLLCDCFLYCKAISKTRRKGFCPSPCINLLVISFDSWIRAWVTLPSPARESFGKAAARSSGAALRVMPPSRSRSTPAPLQIQQMLLQASYGHRAPLCFCDFWETLFLKRSCLG